MVLCVTSRCLTPPSRPLRTRLRCAALGLGLDLHRIEGRRVRYPDNVTLGDIYYFMAAPTLCYELNFPRTNRIRKGFLFRRCTEVVLLLIIITSLVQQWIYPLVDHSLVKFDGSMAIM